MTANTKNKFYWIKRSKIGNVKITDIETNQNDVSFTLKKDIKEHWIFSYSIAPMIDYYANNISKLDSVKDVCRVLEYYGYKKLNKKQINFL